MRLSEEIGLDKEVVDSLSRVFAGTPELAEVLIFGSRANGNFLEGSDIDLVVKGRDLSMNTVLELRAEVELLGLLYKVDIHDFHRIANQELLDHVERVGKVFWTRDQI